MVCERMNRVMENAYFHLKFVLLQLTEIALKCDSSISKVYLSYILAIFLARIMCVEGLRFYHLRLVKLSASYKHQFSLAQFITKALLLLFVCLFDCVLFLLCLAPLSRLLRDSRIVASGLPMVATLALCHEMALPGGGRVCVPAMIAGTSGGHS